ncbi:putative ABC transporter permease [Enterococcus hermanniensis]|uniref:ABC transporter permease n=1 Tax=Enterococcus hermanniensis TaxID=249189 RepID=A0A1L8TRN3_9ENTE|nr:hypothetical protein [Enterococcus hermanniensis]OJG46937.1 hypothetical protein RV04_GL000184 [Enterococcus hermanniensis]
MESIFMTFIVYSFIGWVWESIYCSFKARHYVYRGFLLGPYCPVYGFGVSAVILLVPEHAGTLLNLYFNIVVIVTIIEFFTSWILEKFFSMKLWDYSKVPLNIEGRVAVPVSLFWGIGCLFLLKVINPVIQEKIHDFAEITNSIGPIILAILFFADVLATLIFTLTTKSEVEAVVDTSDSNNAAIKEFRLEHLFSNRKSSNSREKVIELIKNRPMKLKHHNLNRLVKNYPNISFRK